MEHDVFISHASEDKTDFVAPLASMLSNLGVKVWYDEFTLRIGDSLSRSIDKGLSESSFGIVVLSKNFVSKSWTEYELRGLVSKEIGANKVILPIWHNISREDVLKFSPPLADKYALVTNNTDLYEIALKVTEVVRPDIHKNLLRLKKLRELEAKSKPEKVKVSEILLGPIRHETLPDNLLIRIKVIYHIFSDVLAMSLDESIENFRRDLNPIDEINHWEKLAATYLDVVNNKKLNLEKRKDIARVLLGISVGNLNDDNAISFNYLTYEEVVAIVEIFGTVVPKITQKTSKKQSKNADQNLQIEVKKLDISSDEDLLDN